jgi:hypothetical protein
LVPDLNGLLLRGPPSLQCTPGCGVRLGCAGPRQPDSSHRPLPHLWGRTDALIGSQNNAWGKLEPCHIHRDALSPPPLPTPFWWKHCFHTQCHFFSV